MKSCLAILLLALSGKALAVDFDAAPPIELRRDVLQYHVSRGATPEQACAVVLRYFGGICKPNGKTFTLADAPGNGASFYAVITLESP